MDRKPVLIQILDLAAAEEQRFVRALTPEERLDPGALDNWSPKDRLAHIAVWKQRSADDIRLGLEGRPPQREADYDFDQANAELYDEYHEKSWQEVLDLAQEARQSMVDLVAELDEDQLASQEILPRPGDPPLWRVIVGNGFSHPLVHLADFYRERDNLLRSSEIIGRMARAVIDLDDGPVWQGTVRYNLACHYALLGQKTRAIHELRGALSLNPALVEWSRQDPDLDSLRSETAYEQVYDI